MSTYIAIRPPFATLFRLVYRRVFPISTRPVTASLVCYVGDGVRNGGAGEGVRNGEAGEADACP